MKKFLLVTLFSALILIFTGCESSNKLDMATAISVYGEDYQVINMDNVNFLIKWEDATMIFRNNECVQVVKVK